MTTQLTKRILAGAILAGGNASRMGGIAKGAMKMDKGVSIIEHLIDQFYLAGIRQVVILANDPQPYCNYGVEILKDIRTGFGPIGGIEAGLVHLADRCDAVMFVPCDMPNITAMEMDVLRDSFARSNTRVVCAETADFFWHPLCAVVHNSLIDAISFAMDRGEKTVCSVWKQLGAEGVHFSEEKVFLNMNTFSDVEKWRKDRDEKKNNGKCFSV